MCYEHGLSTRIYTCDRCCNLINSNSGTTTTLMNTFKIQELIRQTALSAKILLLLLLLLFKVEETLLKTKNNFKSGNSSLKKLVGGGVMACNNEKQLLGGRQKTQKQWTDLSYLTQLRIKYA